MADSTFRPNCCHCSLVAPLQFPLISPSEDLFWRLSYTSIGALCSLSWVRFRHPNWLIEAGGGGKGTWGDPLDLRNYECEIERGDPLYDSDEVRGQLVCPSSVLSWLDITVSARWNVALVA